jgi:DNA-binding NarL/FixJ family response regulator
MSKILIIEDEIIVAKDMEQMLVDNGYEVVGIASTYERARLKLLATTPPDLILCDIHIGGDKTGIDLMAELSDKLSVPFVFISAYSDIETMSEALALAPRFYLAKPFTERQLLAAIYLVCGSSPRLNVVSNVEYEPVTSSLLQ